MTNEETKQSLKDTTRELDMSIRMVFNEAVRIPEGCKGFETRGAMDAINAYRRADRGYNPSADAAADRIALEWMARNTELVEQVFAERREYIAAHKREDDRQKTQDEIEKMLSM